MTNIDELQARRDELMDKIISVRPYNNIKRGANFSELKRLTDEMLDALRDGQPEEAESANVYDELWRQIRTLQDRALLLEQADGGLRKELDDRVGKLEEAESLGFSSGYHENVCHSRAVHANRRISELEKDMSQRLKTLAEQVDHIDNRVAGIEQEAAAYDDMLERMDADTDADEAQPAPCPEPQPCPHCGTRTYAKVHHSSTKDGYKFYRVQCEICDMMGPKMRNRKDAINAWDNVGGSAPADTVPADPVRALSIVAAAAFDVIDSAVERGHVNNATIYEQDWGTLRDELGIARCDVDNALAGRKAANHG